MLLRPTEASGDILPVLTSYQSFSEGDFPGPVLSEQKKVLCEPQAKKELNSRVENRSKKTELLP